MMRLILFILLPILLTSCSTSSLNNKVTKTDHTTKNCFDLLILSNDDKPKMTMYELQSYMKDLSSRTFDELPNNTNIIKEHIYFNRYVIIDISVDTQNELYHRDYFVRYYSSYLYDLKNKVFITSNSWEQAREFMYMLIETINNPYCEWETFGVDSLPDVISVIAFKNHDVVTEQLQYQSPTTKPKFHDFGNNTYQIEFYVREPWTMFSTPFTYCKLTITPDKIEFESHDVKLDGHTTDADGNIIEEEE